MLCFSLGKYAEGSFWPNCRYPIIAWYRLITISRERKKSGLSLTTENWGKLLQSRRSSRRRGKRVCNTRRSFFREKEPRLLSRPKNKAEMLDRCNSIFFVKRQVGLWRVKCIMQPEALRNSSHCSSEFLTRDAMMPLVPVWTLAASLHAIWLLSNYIMHRYSRCYCGVTVVKLGSSQLLCCLLAMPLINPNMPTRWWSMIANSRKKNLSGTELHFNGQATEAFLSCFRLYLLIKDFFENVAAIKKPVATYEVPPGHKQCFSKLWD